jgi:hypothetical protein
MVAKAPRNIITDIQTIPIPALQPGADDSMDERDVEAMLLAKQEEGERSMRYDDDEQYHHHQYGDEDMESEEDLGFIRPEWPHVLTVDDVRLCRTKALSTNRRSALERREPFSGFTGLSRCMFSR